MMRPVVGVIANAHLVENRFTVQAVGERTLRAVAEVVGALPLMFAGAPDITDIGSYWKRSTACCSQELVQRSSEPFPRQTTSRA
jgi:hypothetical protein